MTSSKIGPTNRYPDGSPLNTTDQGGIAVGVTVLREQRRIVMRFGATLQWLALTTESASQSAAAFRRLVLANFGEVPYAVDTLPLKITVDQSREIIKTTLPAAASELVANPEVFLAWAELLDDAVTKVTKGRRVN